MRAASLSVCYLSVLQIEASPRLSCGRVGVNSEHEGLFAGCKRGVNVNISLTVAVLTDESSRGCLALNAEYSSAHVGLVSLDPERHWDGSNAVHAEVGN